GRAIGHDGHRLALINDHSQVKPFTDWYRKVTAAYQFLFGDHPYQSENLGNLQAFLAVLGAEPADRSNAAEKAGLTPADSPRSRDLGAIDVFEHEFGPNFLLTPLTAQNGQTVTLAQLASLPYEPPPIRDTAALPRHVAFLSELGSVDDNAYVRRSYL